MGDSILSGLREHKMSHRRSLKVRYFPGARMADMKYYSVPLLIKQPEPIILHIGTNDAPFLTPENMFNPNQTEGGETPPTPPPPPPPPLVYFAL